MLLFRRWAAVTSRPSHPCYLPAPRPTIEAFSGLTLPSFLPLLGFFVAILVLLLEERAVANNRPSLISIWSLSRARRVPNLGTCPSYPRPCCSILLSLKLRGTQSLLNNGGLQRLDASQLLALARFLGCHVGISPFLLVQLLHTRTNLVSAGHRPAPINLEGLHQRLNLRHRRVALL